MSSVSVFKLQLFMVILAGCHCQRPVITINDYVPSVPCPAAGKDWITVTGKVDLSTVDHALWKLNVDVMSGTDKIFNQWMTSCSPSDALGFYCVSNTSFVYEIKYVSEANIRFSGTQVQFKIIIETLNDFELSANNVTYPVVKEAVGENLVVDGNSVDAASVECLVSSGNIPVIYSLTNLHGVFPSCKLDIIDDNSGVVLNSQTSCTVALVTVVTATSPKIRLEYDVNNACKESRVLQFGSCPDPDPCDGLTESKKAAIGLVVCIVIVALLAVAIILKCKKVVKGLTKAEVIASGVWVLLAVVVIGIVIFLGVNDSDCYLTKAHIAAIIIGGAILVVNIAIFLFILICRKPPIPQKMEGEFRPTATMAEVWDILKQQHPGMAERKHTFKYNDTWLKDSDTLTKVLDKHSSEKTVPVTVLVTQGQEEKLILTLHITAAPDRLGNTARESYEMSDESSSVDPVTSTTADETTTTQRPDHLQSSAYSNYL